MGAETVQINYEAVQVLHRGELRFRSWRMGVVFLACCACALVGAKFAFAGDWETKFGGLWFLVIGAAGVCFIGTCMVIDRRSKFEIRTDGIALGRRFVPWTEVKKLAADGTPGVKTVQLFYKNRWGQPQHLVSTRPLTPENYEKLIVRVREALGETYPQLTLGGYESVGG